MYEQHVVDSSNNEGHILIIDGNTNIENRTMWSGLCKQVNYTIFIYSGAKSLEL